jgi:hypothetical protein
MLPNYATAQKANFERPYPAGIDFLLDWRYFTAV